LAGNARARERFQRAVKVVTRMTMNPDERNQWLVQHIPHRLRACLAHSGVQKELMPDTADEKTQQNIVAHCVLIAALEGRMAAIRWLIEFVGIRDYNGKPGRPKPHKAGTDVSITSIQGGKLIDLSSHDATILANVWKGCSQASGHPTWDTKHPPVDGATLDQAVRIIVKHLDATIYSVSGRNLLAETLVPNPGLRV